ncbi:SDR family NAD(P)-dependent oxidoreductase [Streptomyces sp. NPDC048419]|uniref:SDR family NAD(P)-dependent oxidoreductase n=1 Tax=Streptomyces sp. NPDC048419 TaxID=3365547 RepID=UPI00371191B0
MNSSQESDLDRRLARDPIAIVGLSALFPKSSNLREFWSNVVSAADCIDDVPAGHWDVDEHYDPDPTVPDKTYAKRGGFIPDTPFNPLEFGLPPNTLEVTDVLQLLSLVVTRDLLKDAGADQAWYDKARTGVVLGITGANQLTQPLTARLQSGVLKEVVQSCGLSQRDAEEIVNKFRLAYAPWEENSFPGMLGNVVAGRVANRFDLGGINMTIDAACASSLGAVRAAVSELVERRADTMLVGGCDAENTIFMYLCFSKTPALSKSGHIRPFDKDADGTLIGEGIGMLALRRLSDAERDGNKIYAVLRGIGTSSDGRFKSIYAPRKEGQMVALRRAYEDADCSPASIELFEAHGTGTAVGDATELSALSAVVSDASDEHRFAALGSIKSQIGHTKAAAGAAGMIKLSLALHHKVLPPTINVDEPNPAIDFTGGPVYVNSETRPWIRTPERPKRRAALSSFGFGGTNFHVVLEEYGDGDDLRVTHPVATVHLWHAPDTAQLTAALAAGTPATGGPAPAGHARIAFVARSAQELDDLRTLALGELRARPDADDWAHPKGVYFRRTAAASGKVAALFAGQGSQYVNPGRSAVMALPPLRAAFDAANGHFDGVEPLSRIAFPPPVFDDAERAGQETALRATAYAQPAIGALSAGQFTYLTELGFRAEGFLGHSFGELTALWAAGALTDDAFHALARARGKAMAPPQDPGFDAGAMAAVPATEERVAELLAQRTDLVVCNRNAPDQIVVGGPTEEIERLVADATAAGLRAKRLPVSAAFHTSFVGHALDAFRADVERHEVSAPTGTVYANTRGAAYGDDIAANRTVLAEQLINPVDFATRVEDMYAAGHRVFVEFGPRSVLTQLVRRILGDREHTAISLDAGPGRDADVALKQAVAQLAVQGLPLATGDRYVEPVAEEVPAKGMAILLNGINYVSPERKAKYRDAIDNGYTIAVPTLPGTNGSAPTATSAGTGGGAAAPAPPPAPEPAPAPAAAPRTVAASAPAPASARVAISNGARPAASSKPATAPVAQSSSTAVAVHEPGPVAAPADPTPAPASTVMETPHVDSDRLADLVADHLALHDDYMNSQLQSAQRLTGLLERAAEQGHLGQILPGVNAVKEHGLDIGRSHLRANEVLRDLAGLELGTAVPTAAPAPAPVQPAPRTEAQPALPAAAPAALAPALAPAPQALATAPAPAPAPQPVTITAPTTAAQPPAPAAEPTTPGVDAAGVEAALLEVVGAKTGYPTDMLELDMDVEADLGIDSIKRVEIMGVMQERFGGGAAAGPEQLAELRTLRDIVGFMANSSAPTSVSAAPAATAAPAVDAASVEAALLEVVGAKTGYPADMLDLDMDVEADLGIDSIKRVEIMGVMQERFGGGTAAGPEQLAELRTLRDIVGFMANSSAPTAVSAAPAGTAAPAVDAASVEAALLEVVGAKTGYPADMLDLDMDVEADLGIDSIKRVEIMGVMQEKFGSGTAAGPEQLAELRTLRHIVDFMAGTSAATGTQTTTPATVAADAPSPDEQPGGGIGRAQAALVELPTPDRLVDAYPNGSGTLIVDDGSELATALAAQLTETGTRVHVLRLPGVAQRISGVKDHALSGWGVTELAEQMELVLADRISLVLDLSAAHQDDFTAGTRRLAHTLLVAKHAVEALNTAADAGRAAFVTVTRLDGAFGLTGVAEHLTPAAGVAGLVKTLAVEAPRLFCRSVDLAPELTAETGAALVLAEAQDAATDATQAGHDGTRRLGLGLAEQPLHPATGDVPALTSEDLIVVTGGGRGITADCVTELARRHRAGLLLLGRTPLEDEPAWAQGVEDSGLKAAAAARLKASGEKPTPKRVEQLFRAVTGAREIRATLTEVAAAGSTVEYLAVDITDPAATAAALAPYKERVTGLVHGAGVLADQLIANKKASEIERVFAPKLAGLRTVADALDAENLRHVVLFSSVAGFFGNRGQSDYAMANEVLNAWASSFRQRHPAARVTSLNWGAWDSGMVSPEIKAVFKERGIVLIPVGTGAGLFTEQFDAERAGDVVTVLGPTTPLSEPERAAATGPVTVERGLDALPGDPIVADHVIGEAPVLPAVVALGWAIGAVERGTGTEVRQVSDFEVHKGIVFDDTRPEQLALTMTPAGDQVQVAIRSTDAKGAVRPHFAAVVSPGAAPAPATVSGLPALGGGRDADGLYTDGTLFHGPALRGIRRLLAEDEARLVLQCELPELRPEGGAFGGSAFAPGTADLLLQAGLVWVRLFRDSASLPLGLARADLHHPLPDGAPFLIVVEPGQGSTSTTASLTITACAPDGTVLARFDGVRVVSAPQLAAKFISG